MSLFLRHINSATKVLQHSDELIKSQPQWLLKAYNKKTRFL